MNKELQNIISGIGLGNIKFGFSREQVKALLGEPEETEQSASDDEVNSETWHYDALELSLSFDEEEDWKLVALSISSDFYHFEGSPMIGLSTDDFLSALEQNGVSDIDLEETIQEDKMTLEHYFSEEKAMSFWLEDGRVADVQWTILFVDDDTIDWPQ